MRLVAWTLTSALVFAGCIVSAPDGPGDSEPNGTRSVFFTQTMHLSDAAGGEGAVPTGAFFQRWADGSDYATWSTEPMLEDVVVDAMRVTLRVRATGPVAESGRFPDIMLYAGGGGAWTGFASISDESVFVPGTVYEFELEPVPPEGGLWVPKGEAFGLKVVPVMLQQDTVADIEVLVGPGGSTATWSQRPLGEAPRPTAIVHEEGEAVGSAYAGAAAPASTSMRFPVDIPPGARGLVAWMNVTANEGVPDVDFSLEDEAGAVVAFSGTPTPREHLKLHADQLPPGTHHLVVTSYGSARAAFTVDYAVE